MNEKSFDKVAQGDTPEDNYSLDKVARPPIISATQQNFKPSSQSGVARSTAYAAVPKQTFALHQPIIGTGLTNPTDKQGRIHDH